GTSRARAPWLLRPHDGGGSLALRWEDTEAPVIGVECLAPALPASKDVADATLSVIDGDHIRLGSVGGPLWSHRWPSLSNHGPSHREWSQMLSGRPCQSHWPEAPGRPQWSHRCALPPLGAGFRKRKSGRLRPSSFWSN